MARVALYACRSATNGSTRVALRAGTKHAANATAANNPEIAANVIGSVAFTSNSI